MFNPVSTYRLQFHAGFTFADFERIIPYLQHLGVKTIYASPVFKAVPGSTHGYDGLNAQEINPEIGNLEQLRQLSLQLKERGMSWIQDIVPNHMAFHPGNEWLMDVLEKGRRSAYAPFFDIGWNNPHENRLMVPFLGAAPGEVFRKGEIKVAYVNGRFVFDYYGNTYPLSPQSYGLLLAGGAAPDAGADLLQQIEEINHMEDVETYAERWNNWRKDFEALMQQVEVKNWMDASLQKINGDPSRLQQVADEQHFRLCFWQETDHTINYRRFFTVNGLICINVQDQPVFDRYHALVKTLLDENIFQGLRVDHIDGLYKPYEYLQRLRTLAGSETYSIVEKILAADEHLPLQWPVQGTTGYEFLAMVSNVLTQEKNEPAFTEYYYRLGTDRSSVPAQVRSRKAYILYRHMGGELDNLYRLLLELELVEAQTLQKLPAAMLKKAIGEFLVHCPVYRYYGDNLPFSPEEAAAVRAIITSVKETEPDISEAIGVLELVWLIKPLEGDSDHNRRAAHFYKRCMQFSGPLMAKGVEDTLMYTFNRFIAHNEVGDAPDAFGSDKETFHGNMKQRQKHWPLSLNATSTHDTKRGEDVRARLNVLSSLPGLWFQTVEKWREMNKSLKQNGAPDVNDEYFIYQTIIGTCPMPGSDDPHYAGRLKEYLQKALREAKQHSNWTTPDEAYEEATQNFALGLLDKNKPFWKSFERVHKQIADYGIVHSLVQVVLKFTCPGVPDIYQGGELWDLSFVDPDNRRPVAFDKHEGLLKPLLSNEKPGRLARVLWRNRLDGRIKLWLVHALLQLRNKQEELFAAGDYIPLSVVGAYKENVLAFARKQGRDWLFVAVPLHIAEICHEQDCSLRTLNWKDTRVVLPKELKGKWTNALLEVTGMLRPELPVRDLFQRLPFAVLHMEAAANTRAAGILLHITSLPSPFGIGDLGPEAYKFADSLHKSGQRYWQLLPVNPVENGQGYSPYSAVSSRAGNTLLISPELLAKEGLLREQELEEFYLPSGSIADYAGAEKVRNELFERAWISYNENTYSRLHHMYNEFCRRENDWLADFALYVVLKQENDGKPWYEWEEKYRRRLPDALGIFVAENETRLEKAKWLQFIFDLQWSDLKRYCNKHSIDLIGDLPFYISYDSADVWAHKDIFLLDAEGGRIGLAGVPPDAFSDDGQLWGMPVFNWQVLKKSGYGWWLERLRKNREMFDFIRLDHFRAFSAYWEVPNGEKTARNGKWKPGPGADFFNTVIKQLGVLPFLAEDLGEIDEPVYVLRDKFSFPGMKILQFAFGDDFPGSDYLPHKYSPRFFAYTGTHDNNTVRGWYRQEAGEDARKNLMRYSGRELTEDNAHLILAQIAYASVAQTVILPLQDVLGLDETARMNTPSAANGNWKWRLLPGQLTEEALMQLHEWVEVYGRGQ